MWLRDELKKKSSYLLYNLSDCPICAPDLYRGESTIFFGGGEGHQTWSQQIDLITPGWLHSLVGKSNALTSKRSWVGNSLFLICFPFNRFLLLMESSGSIVVRALVSHYCTPGSISRLGLICGLSLLVLYPALRGSSPICIPLTLGRFDT